MSLREPVAVPDVADLGAVHVMAVGGVSMSGLAESLARRGLRVSGCDRAESDVLARLRAQGVTTQIGHDPSHLDDVDTVLVSSAIAATNPELTAAHERGLRVLHRSAALAALMRGRRGIGIAGTHGKTTTSAMVVQALAGKDPSYHVGSTLASTGVGEAEGTGPDYVIEADESDGSFLQYDCAIVAITNVEADHLDNWGTPEHYADGFYTFATRPGVKHCVVGIDDEGGRHLADRLREAGRAPVTVGTADDADVRVIGADEPTDGSSPRLDWHGEGGELRLSVPGAFNLRDAAVAYACARLAGVDDAEARARLAEFRGTARRFQPVAEVAGIRIIDDYAHHPTEIAATLGAARSAAGAGRVVAIFQPHLFTRTRDFAVAFGRELAAADVIVVTDIYPAREQHLPGVTGELVVDAVRAAEADAEVRYIPDLTDLPAGVAALVRPGDTVLTIGAGSITAVGPRLAALLEGA